MLKRVYIRLSALLVLFAGACVIGVALFLPRLMDLNAYRNQVIASLQQALNRKVAFSNATFSMQIGPAFTFDNVRVMERDGTEEFLVARRIRVHLALFPLLGKKVVLRDVAVESARLRIERDATGKLNITDLLVPKQGAYQLQLRKIALANCDLRWRDFMVQDRVFQADVKIVNLELDGVSPGHKGSVKLDCVFPGRSGASGHAGLSGTVRLSRTGKPPGETDVNLDADFRQLDINQFWPYFERYIPFGRTGGYVDLKCSLKGKAGQFTSKGKLRLSAASVTWPAVFHAPVNPKIAQLEYELKRETDSIDMPDLRFAVDGVRVRGSCRLQDITSPDPRIIARASSDPVVLEHVHHWIPYGIIASDTSQYIERHITGGLFRLESGVLEGHVSQIAHMERGTNYNVLRIRGTVDKGIVSYGPRVPAFTNIKANLDLLGKDFILGKATATFGASPFKLEGRITDYPLITPCQYLFQMEMNPHAAEVAWLSRLAGISRLDYSGGSRLLLRGSGFSSAYQLSGDWDLKLAAYANPGSVYKPAGMRNNLSFNALLSPGGTRLNSLTYNLPPLTLSATAQLTYGANPHLGFELQTNPFSFNEALPILTRWQAYRPRGRMQAHIKGSGNPADFSAMDYSGAVSLTAFALQPVSALKPLSNINGAITFKGNSLETTNITARYGGSMINLKGKVRNFGNPEADIRLSSPELYLRDLSNDGYHGDAAVHRLSAWLILHDGTYAIRGLSGQFNASTFTMNGTYQPKGAPALNLAVNAPHLDLADVFVLARARSAGGEGMGEDLRIKLNADSGKYGALEFSHMNLTLSRDSGVYYLQNLEGAFYGGTLKAKGRIAPDNGGVNRYDLNLDLRQVNSERLFHTLEITRQVTGKLNLNGNITARGANLPDIKRSALGNLKLHLENGTMRKFSVLSKLFSILNFSQLLKFQLPDMVQGGMPYNDITASLSVKDGVVSTQDMFISSDAINISVLGSTDIVKEELNLSVGVQPLQTVDKVINRIPLLGWIITGKGKTAVTIFFEAKGKWSNPQVSAIPVKSMSKGALHIFRRVFELPVRAFTNAGEVFLGQ